MADFNQTRSDYLKIMMGGENSASSPYRPEQLNDLGGTSFDAASLSDTDIDNAIKTLSQAGQEGTAVFNALNTEKEKREKGQEEKSWWDNVVDFLVNAGTSITEGIFKAVDEVKDFAIGVGAGLFGGGWFGAKNDFTDWAADVMKDDRWIDYATRAVDMVQANILRKEFWTGEGGYWSDWSYENTKRLQERHYEGLGWERTAGSFVGEMVPNLILAYFTGGSSLGVQAAAQGGLGFARGMGEAQSRALSEGASFQQSAGYGAVKGAIRGAMSAALTYAGGTFASRSANSAISKVGSKVGDAVLKKTGSVGLSAFANNATKFVIRVAGDAGEAAVFTAIEPALQQIYNDNAWYNAYGTEENRRSYAEQIGKSALIAAAFSAVTNALRDVIDIHRAGGRKAYLEKYAKESYQRITENEVLKSLSPADRELAKQGADEWAKIEKEMQNIQNEYDTMKAKGIPESELEMYVHRSKESLSERIEAYSGKYGGLFNKMAAKTHPDYLGTTDNARLSDARTSVFQKYASMTNKGLKEQLSNLINGDNGITALLSYTKGSEPVETVKENDNLVAKPQNAEQVQSVLAAASQDKGNVPSVIELPLKGGTSAQINIDGLQASQLEKLANLTVSDLKQEGGSSVADLGKGKSLVISSDFKTAKIVGTNEMLANVESKGDNGLYETGFRELQKTSRAELSSKSWAERSHSIDEGLRGRLSRTFEQELINRGYGDRSDNGVLTLSSKANTFDIYENVDADTFHDVFEVARTYLENGELVDLHGVKTTEDMVGYEDTKNYLSKDGMSGFAITKDGDLISVFNLSSKRGFLRAIAPFIKKNVKTLDCYISNKQNLQEMYSKIFGFKTASVMDWNPKYDHDDIGKNHSTPKVAFMVNANHRVETKQFGKDDYGAAKDYQIESAKPVPFETKAEASIVKEAANAKVGKVYSLTSAKDMADAVESAIKSILTEGTMTKEAVPVANKQAEAPKAKHISTLMEEKFAEPLKRMTINELDDRLLAELDTHFEGNTGLTLEILDYNRHDLEPEIVRARAGKPLSRYDSSLADYQGDYPLTSKILFGITYDKSDIANYDDPESQAYFDYKAMQDRIAPVVVEEFENMTSALDDAIEPLSEEDFSRAYSAYRYALSDAWQGFLDDAESAYNEKFYNMDEWFDEIRTAMDYYADSFDRYIERMMGEQEPETPAEPQAVTSAIENAKLDKYGKGEMAKMLFDNLNLGNEEQQAAAKEAFRKRLLDTEVKYDIKEGEETKTYTYKLSDMLGELDGDKTKEFNDEFDKAWGELASAGEESRLTKVIEGFARKLENVLAYAKDLKESVRIFGHLEKHRGNILRRYYHDNGETFGPSFDFDTQGYKVLLEPLHQLKPTNGKNSYTGKSAIAAFNQFLENYKAENFASHPTDNDDIVVYSNIYNQGLRDLASALVESIQDNSYIDKNGKQIYSSLDTRQLAMLRLFQDEVEKMPKRAETEAIEARKMAESAYQGVLRYISSFLKNGEIGKARSFLQMAMEIYGNQLDALIYEAGDNELSKLFYDDLYLASSQARGMEDDYRGKIADIRKAEDVTNKKLNSLSDFTDVKGKKVEMRYLVRVYHHLMSGEESNNVKYIEANTVYLVNSAKKIVHICKFSYADMDKIADTLSNAHLLGYANGLHLIESSDLRKVYDADYIRDCHIPNSNSISDYTKTVLASNGSRLGKAYIQHGTANYGSRQDRVKEIPTGVHLVIEDAEESIMGSVRNQANIHFIDPVLKNINLTYGTKLNERGTTVKEYVIENNPQILELSTRCIFGAYGVNPNKQGRFINFVGNGYVMSLIGMNPSTILKQPISIMWSNDISLGTVLKFTLAANLNKTIWQNSTRLKKEIEEEFPELRLRGKQNEVIMGNVAADAVGRLQRGLSTIAGFGLKKSDAWTVGHEAIGLLAIQGQRLGYGEIGTPENDAYVKTHYRAFYATQVSSNRITMSGARAGYYGGVFKFTAFMTGAIQGQMGHLVRAVQQIIEFKGKTQQYYDDLIEKTKAGEIEAKQAYEDAKAKLDETIKDFAEGNAEKEDVKSAKEDAKAKFEEYARAAGEKADAEHSAKAFRHFSDMGGTKGVVIQRLAGALITGLLLVGINELASRLKGQKRWDEFDVGSAGTELAINTLGGWLPVVRDVVSAVKGYDMEIPEYIIVSQVHDLFSAIGEAVRDPSEKNGRAIIRQAIESISAFLGIPATNLWKYANGIIKTFSPSTAIQMNNLLYGASAVSLAKNAKEYAERNDISTASDLYQSLYAIAKTGEISREVAVEQTKLIAEGFNPTAKNIPSYVQDEEGARVDLTEKERDDFLKFYSKANEQVERLIKNARYKSYQPETKAKEIKKVYDLYYEAARYRALGIDPQSKLGRLLAYASDYDDDIIALLVLIQQNSELADNARFTKKEQALKLVNKQAMSKKQKMLALYLMGYGLSDENRKLVRNYLESLGFSKKQAEEFLPDKAVAEK